MGKGAFFVLDGMPLTGKSTLIPRLKRRLLAQYSPDPDGKPRVYTADDPGSSDSRVLDLLTLWRQKPLAWQQENARRLAVLYSLNRATISQYVDFEMGEGSILLMDRWSLSTMAFQGLESWELEPVEKLLGIRKPDHTFILSTWWDEAQRRLRRTERPRKIWDGYDRTVWNRVRKTFIRFALADRTNITIMEGGSLDETEEVVYAKMVEVLGGLGCR